MGPRKRECSNSLDGIAPNLGRNSAQEGDPDVFLAAQKNCSVGNSIVWMLKERQASLSLLFPAAFRECFIFLSSCSIAMLPVPKVPKGAMPQKYKLNERILQELCIVKLNCCLVFSSTTGQSNRESMEGAEKLVLEMLSRYN